MNVLRNISLLPYNTFGIDEEAECLVEYDTVGELRDILRNTAYERPLLHIGDGSNLLFLKKYSGTILKSRIKSLEVIEQDDEHITVRVGAGWEMDAFIRYSISQGWYGIENLSHIPGQVGASAVQNIGAYGTEACEHIATVHCMAVDDGAERTFDNAECGYAYRHSIFKTPEMRGRMIVTHVDYRLSKVFEPKLSYGPLQRAAAEVPELTAEALRDIIIDIRTRKLPDPKVTGNAGSFFMNPIVARERFESIQSANPSMPYYEVDADHIKIPAGWLIEQCGWKGRTLGPAGVHPHQALVLVNNGGAKGQDIVNLCNAIIGDVRQRFGITLRPEVNFI